MVRLCEVHETFRLMVKGGKGDRKGYGRSRLWRKA